MWTLTTHALPPLHEPVLVVYPSGQRGIASCGQRGTMRVWGQHGVLRSKTTAPIMWHPWPDVPQELAKRNVDKTKGTQE